MEVICLFFFFFRKEMKSLGGNKELFNFIPLPTGNLRSFFGALLHNSSFVINMKILQFLSAILTIKDSNGLSN
jgi:hypothetical protein